MSYLVARMQKVKSQNLGEIQERSNDVIDLVNSSEVNYKERILKIIEEQKEGTKAIRKDAVLVNEWVISSDQKFFEGLNHEKIQNFFMVAVAFFEERYGKQNIAYGHVYLHIKIPQLHIGIIPLKDGKLQAKNVFNRMELLVIQDGLPRFLRKKGFKIARGVAGSEGRYLTLDEFNEMESRMSEMAQIEEKMISSIKSLQKEKDALERRINHSKEHLEIKHAKQKTIQKQQVKTKQGDIIVYLVPEVEMLRMDGIRKATNEIFNENKRLESENNQLKVRINMLENKEN